VHGCELFIGHGSRLGRRAASGFFPRARTSVHRLGDGRKQRRAIPIRSTLGRNIRAIACGRNGLIAIDCDRHGGPDGVEAFKKLVAANGGPPRNMPVVSPPNNGLHVFFKQPNGEALGNARGSLPPGIDVRGDGDTPLTMLWPSTFCTRGSMGFFTAWGAAGDVVPKFGSLDDPAPTSSRA
jgi:hypothetical protein